MQTKQIDVDAALYKLYNHLFKPNREGQVIMRQIDMYICHPFRGKCKQYNRPKFECGHAKPHILTNADDDCSATRDCICGGICRKIKE